jgi:hypothetical protein
MFDLKTRAVVSIRMEATEHERGMGYEIRRRYGKWESYEREYFDMIRAAFLKYSLQVRVGRMDGIFVAYHNIERIFGFQYIPLVLGYFCVALSRIFSHRPRLSSNSLSPSAVLGVPCKA